MPFIAIFLILFACLLLWRGRQQRQATGLPGGTIIYSDMRGWNPLEKPLYDPDLGLTGKPDYLVEKGGQIIPVEVKTSPKTNAPYDTHIYQLAAYCWLVQHTYGRRPPYGILHYSDHRGSGLTYRIDYTASLENSMLNILDDMRTLAHLKEIPRSHESASRCRHCGYRTMCDQRVL